MNTFRDIFRSVIMCFSTFSKIPMPQIKWSEQAMRYIMCALPLIGVCIGAVECGVFALCVQFNVGVVLKSVFLMLVPIAITGGIHLDGLGDVIDALASNASPQKMREILKDPHVGVFAIIGICGYMLLYTGLLTEVLCNWVYVAIISLMFVCSRACTGLGVLIFKSSSNQGMLAMFKSGSNICIGVCIQSVWIIICAVALIMVGGILGVCAFATSIVCLLLTRLLAQRRFGGLSGDLAGFCIQITELAALLVLFVGKVIGA